MHACTSLDMVVRVDVERMVTTQTSSSQPPLDNQRPECPSGGMNNKFVGLILGKCTQ